MAVYGTMDGKGNQSMTPGINKGKLLSCKGSKQKLTYFTSDKQYELMTTTK